MRRAPCPLCGGGSARDVILLDEVPVHCHLLCDSAEEARRVSRGRIRLVHCPACDLFWNADFEPARTEYGPRYENALDYSPTFRRYARRLALHLARSLGEGHGRILEIGCGSGAFLRSLCTLSGRPGLGVDPSAPEAPEIGGVAFSRDPEAWRAACREADLVVFRHLLEHLSDPVGFLGEVRSGLEGKDALVYCEVPDTRTLLREVVVWDLLYEHVAYFTPRSLAAAFAAADFRVTAIRSDFGGQFLGLEACPGLRGPASPGSAQRTPAALVERFRTEPARRLRLWGRRLGRWVEAGERVVLWGAGTKGVMFLNLVEKTEGIRAVVDVHPRKQGRFVAGTGHPIVSPGDLPGLEPGRVLVTNPNYMEEIRGLLEAHGLRPRLLAIWGDGGAGEGFPGGPGNALGTPELDDR